MIYVRMKTEVKRAMIYARMKTEVKRALISEAQMLLWLVLPVLLSAGLWLAVNPMVRWAWNEVMTNTNEVMTNITNTTIVNTTKVEH